MRTFELLEETGAVLVEWAIVAGGLFLGVLIFHDTTAALNDYMILSQLAHEGTRLISRVPALETGTFSNIDQSATTSEIDECTLALSTSFQCGHYTVQNRMRLVFPLAGLSIAPNNLSITTQYQPDTVAATATDDTVTTTITGTFRGFLIPSLNIRATSQGAYLFEQTP